MKTHKSICVVVFLSHSFQTVLNWKRCFALTHATQRYVHFAVMTLRRHKISHCHLWSMVMINANSNKNGPFALIQFAICTQHMSVNFTRTYRIGPVIRTDSPFLCQSNWCLLNNFVRFPHQKSTKIQTIFITNAKSKQIHREISAYGIFVLNVTFVDANKKIRNICWLRWNAETLL